MLDGTLAGERIVLTLIAEVKCTNNNYFTVSHEYQKKKQNKIKLIGNAHFDFKLST